MAHAGVSIVLMLTSGDLKEVCMQDATDALLGLCSWLHKFRLNINSMCTATHTDIAMGSINGEESDPL